MVILGGWVFLMGEVPLYEANGRFPPLGLLKETLSDAELFEASPIQGWTRGFHLEREREREIVITRNMHTPRRP